MKQARVYCVEQPLPQTVAVTRSRWLLTAPQKLFIAWFMAGVVPFALQMRSYLKFATPHKITQTLIVPANLEKETINVENFCPVKALLLSGVWWNVDPIHYYTLDSKHLCHFVAPQYNTHGNYLIGTVKVTPYASTPSSCAQDSYRVDQYFYHGSLGFYSFYEEQTGTYCAKDHTVYIYGNGLGSYDINGSLLIEDRGSQGYRHSVYYGLVGFIWVSYRALVLRRSFISCKRHGKRCEELGENLTRKEAVIFVQENLRLSAHGARLYHRFALLYLLLEGVMTDLFLLIANEGILAKIQYVSLGYNLSGFLLLVYEIIETLSCVRERYRLFFKRLWFSYETAFLGELLSAALQEQMISALNRADVFEKSKPTALEISYYFWSLVAHGNYVLVLTGFVLSVRTLWAVGYVWSRHRQNMWKIFTEPCSVDSTLKLRGKMTSLGGYRYDSGKLFYQPDALKAFGLLKLREKDGTEYLVLQKQNWLGTTRRNLYIIGIISGPSLEACDERPCTGQVTFFDRRLGGNPKFGQEEDKRRLFRAMKNGKVHCGIESQDDDRSISARMTAQRMLLLAWTFAGVVPFILQLRSYLKFATRHKITQNLVVPSELKEEVENLQELCPVKGMLLSGCWFNIEPTHYFSTGKDRLCHFVIPQYNVHGTFSIGDLTSEPYYTTPSICMNGSFSYEQYFYHGSIGFYSFYEEQTGSYCPTDNTAYIVGQGLGTSDLNGPSLATDRGKTHYRYSLWYTLGGVIWLVYRALVLRRCFISCKRYGRMCDELGEELNRKEAMVFVQENLRLAAHGARNYHRILVLYLLVESIMTDLFLLVANDGILTKLQYVSMGYNMSALLVMVFEIIESAGCLPEKWRVRTKRLLFSYETTFIGEVCTAALQQYSLTLLNRSNLKETHSTALAVSYYVWSLVGHGVFVLAIIALVISVRALWAIGYGLLSYRTWAIFTASCGVDTTLKLRNKMFLLGGYRWENGTLYYTTSALKAFGLFKMEEDGKTFLVLHKIRWFRVLRDDFIAIATISNHRVKKCEERSCSGMLQFCDRKLAGETRNTTIRSASRPSLYIHVKQLPPTSASDPNNNQKRGILGDESAQSRPEASTPV